MTQGGDSGRRFIRPRVACVTYSFPYKAWACRRVAGIVFFTEAGEGVGNWSAFPIFREVEYDQSLALAIEENGAHAVVVDIGLERNDPCVSHGFSTGKEDFPAVLDYCGIFGNEAGAEGDGSRLIRDDVNEYAISSCTRENGAYDGGFSKVVGGCDGSVW